MRPRRARPRTHRRGRARPVPSVPGDVWHWQLESMPVVSRRARRSARPHRAPVGVAPARPTTPATGCCWCSRSSPPTRCGTAAARCARSSSPAPGVAARPQRRGAGPAAGARGRPRPRAGRHGPAPGGPAVADYGWEEPARPQARVGAAALGRGPVASPATGCPSRARRRLRSRSAPGTTAGSWSPQGPAPSCEAWGQGVLSPWRGPVPRAGPGRPGGAAGPRPLLAGRGSGCDISHRAPRDCWRNHLGLDLHAAVARGRA